MIKLSGSLESMLLNSNGVVKIAFSFPVNQANEVSKIKDYSEDLLSLEVQLGDDEDSKMVFPSLEFYNLNMKGTKDSKIVFRTLKEYLVDKSFDDLNMLIDAQLKMVLTVMDAKSDEEE